MTAVSSVDSDSVSDSIAEEKTNYWTDAKVEKAWLYTASCISFFGAVLAGSAAAGGTLPLVALAVPLIAVSGILAWYAYKLIDYDDPLVLSRLRQELQDPKLTLSQIVEQHGWEKLFSRGLLSAAAFQTAYAAHVNNLPFASLLRYFHEVQRELTQAPPRNAFARAQCYAVPSPSNWKSKFDQETQSLRCDAIVQKYPLEDLKRFQLITWEQSEILKETQSAIQQRDACYQQLEEKFRRDTPLQHQLYQSAVQIAELEYRRDADSAHTALRQISEQERRKIAAVENSFKWQIHQIKKALEEFRASLQVPGCCLSQEGWECLQRAEQEARARIEALRIEEADQKMSIQYEAACRRAPLEQILRQADLIKTQKIALAQQQFDLTTQPQRAELLASRQKNSDEYEQKVINLDISYRMQMREGY